jgi:hypothetical protein
VLLPLSPSALDGLGQGLFRAQLQLQGGQSGRAAFYSSCCMKVGGKNQNGQKKGEKEIGDCGGCS